MVGNDYVVQNHTDWLELFNIFMKIESTECKMKV